MCMSSNEYTRKDYKMDFSDVVIKCPKAIARVKICGLTFTITDDIEFEMPTEEQRENLKKTFGIEVELIEW